MQAEMAPAVRPQAVDSAEVVRVVAAGDEAAAVAVLAVVADSPASRASME